MFGYELRASAPSQAATRAWMYPKTGPSNLFNFEFAVPMRNRCSPQLRPAKARSRVRLRKLQPADKQPRRLRPDRSFRIKKSRGRPRKRIGPAVRKMPPPRYSVTRSSHLTMASMANIEMPHTTTNTVHVAEIEILL